MRRHIFLAQGTTAQIQELQVRLGEMEQLTTAEAAALGSSWAYGTAPSNVAWSTSSAGVSANLARSDHQHLLSPGTRTKPTRNYSTWYTNTGTAPLFVTVTVCPSSTPRYVQLETPTTTLAYYNSQGAGNLQVPLFAVIAPGESYLLTSDAGAGLTSTMWVEYSLG